MGHPRLSRGSAGEQSAGDVDPDVARDPRQEASPPASERPEHEAVDGEAKRDREPLIAVGHAEQEALKSDCDARTAGERR